MASYPATVYTYSNRTPTETLLAGSHSTAHNEVAAEVIAIENELGVTPKGSYASVAARLAALETVDVDHATVSITAGTGLSGGGTIEATRTLALSHLGLQTLTDPGAHRLMVWDDTDGSLAWVTIGANLTYTQATHTLTAAAGGGATLTRGTFVNADLATGVLTITHNGSIAAPYMIMVTVFDNTGAQVIPDSVVGATSTAAVSLVSYGTLTGTWGYAYII